jgi:hypothetical protein
VTHRVDLLHGGDDAVVLVHQCVQNGLNGLGVGGHGNVNGIQLLLAVHLGLIGEFAVDADALAQALGQQNAGFGIQQLILQEELPALITRMFMVITPLSGKTLRLPCV